MELKKLLVGLEGIKAKGNVDIEIKGIENNSKEVKEGYMFVAIKGFSTDGHQFVENAIENGAKCVMLQEGCDLKSLNISEDVEKEAKDILKIIETEMITITEAAPTLEIKEPKAKKK